MRSRPNVALMIETSLVYGREILRGIAGYLRTHEEWSVFLDEREAFSEPPAWLMDWRGDGIICRWTTPELAERLRQKGIPVVDLNDRYGHLGLPRIGSDMPAIGRMAAEHLLERGFGNIAYCGFSGRAFSEGRRAGVEAAVTGRGTFCGAFESSTEVQRQQGFEEERREISQWLEGLPRPVGIVTCNDLRGYHVLDACRALGLIVPEEVAVIGVDNSETTCELCLPPLSSVVPNARRVGAEAAELLSALMAGADAPAPETLIPPREVVTRQSSDVLAVSNPIVARAVSFIREHACDGLTVPELLAHLRTPRPPLERGFRQFLGHSPQEEIRRVRLKRVKHLLLETDWTLERIAEECGFTHPEYMLVQFKRMVGRPAGQWRADHHVNAADKKKTGRWGRGTRRSPC